MAGVEIIFANDISRTCSETYRANEAILSSGHAEFHQGDVSDIESFPSCDLLIGCYPCQGFSMGGRRSPRDDPRTKLFVQFFRCLEATKPKFFVAENVAGMQWLEQGEHLRRQVDAYRSAGIGYVVSIKLIDAKEHGVPADRKRIFMVGVRRDLGLYYWFPTPTHGPSRVLKS